MCSLSVNTTLFAAFILIYLVSLDFVHGFNFKSVHWTTHGSERLAELSEYEIVTPVRLDDRTGLPLSPDAPTRHFHKRSASPLKSDLGSDEDEPQASFLLGAFHQQFQLNLSRDNSFFSPSFVVEFLGDDDDDAEELDTSAPLHCFYRGFVNGQPTSSAVFSLCDGMYGLFQTPEGIQYFVEPLDDSTSAEEGSTRPHVVYPTTALQDLNKNSGCGLTDEDLRGSSKGPSSPNSTNDVPGSHGSHGNKHHRGNGRQLHSRERGTSNTLAAQLFQMHQRISKSIKQNDNSTKNSDSDTDTTLHKRGKRFISYTRHVELMVVADSKMLNHHGANLEHYLLTLIALVNKIFKDPSIGNDINIVLVKLLVLRSDEENLSITSDAPETLRNFCLWQQDQNQKEDSHPHHYDTAVLITKEDICRSTFDCDTLGLGELGTMCDPRRSCSIVQDNGLSAAFTMAHELGHVFNLPHDDDNNKCLELNNPSGKYGVMAPTLNYQINPWTWSRCSQAKITEYLDMGYGQCLLDSPTDPQPRVLPGNQPGEVYNVSKQCELVFGEGSSVCPIMRTCSRLWCTGSSQGSRRGCRTQHMPWADGTPCGHNKWCDRGKCITRRHNLDPIDGGWGKWEAYGDCSRTCGGGVKQAIRQCSHPEPDNGGKYCIGRRVRFRSCNSRLCSANSIPFREVQCTNYNGNNFNIQGVPRDVRWVPKYSGVQLKDRCSLFCRVEGSIAFYKLAKKVVDGTPCGPDTDDICVQGQCWRAGCDHILGSQTTIDSCGVCGGDDRTCRTVTGFYNKALYGYNKVVEIPAGSTRIDVRQHSYIGIPEDDNYLAIQSSSGEYLLNGHFVVSMFQREIKIGNVVMEYSGSNNSIEKITCYEKIVSNITIFVLSVGKVLPPDIRYSYNVPITDRVLYLWDVYGEWGPCNKMCRGEKVRDLLCLRQSDRVKVKADKCHGPRPEQFKARCNTGCTALWEVTAQSDCSATCGVGRRTRRIECIKTVGRRDFRIPVADSNCLHQPRPAEVVECQKECPESHWEYSAWTQCSRSCDGGTRRRSALCRDANGYYAQDSNCDASSKHIEESCNTQQCPIWAAQSWSDCSVTCGEGHMQRSVGCTHSGQLVDNGQCDPSIMPVTTRPCRMEDCADWHQGVWGPCSATCGQGSMQRSVSCRTSSQDTDPSQCDHSPMPETTRHCEVSQCSFWHQGEWSMCSVTCGVGERQRLVSCYRGTYVIDPSHCDPSAKPLTMISCTMEDCAHWQEGNWTPCSVTCGQGERRRRVSCYQGNHEVDVSHCDGQQPELVSSCQIVDCAAWEYGEWGQCSVTCGHGNQIRLVSCVRGNQRLHETECEQSLVPDSAQPCQMGDCPLWKHSDWGPCSGTCGEGEKQRFVGCYQGNNEVATNQCDVSARPNSVTSCEMVECPIWHQGVWGPCSASCGQGRKQREVGCYQGNHEVDFIQCDMTLMPEEVTPCEVTGCAFWQHGEWGPCSATCGEGKRRRSVKCQQDDGIVDGSQCDASIKPDIIMSCQGVECPDWKGEDWGPCSVTCGQGTRQRRAHCYQGNQEVDLRLCDPTLKPDTTRVCELIECTDWYKGEWGPCSVTCGNGEIRRRVSCSMAGRNVDISLCDGSPMPDAVRGCEMPKCTSWQASQWAQCSATCGQGKMLRKVSCYQGNHIVDSSQCEGSVMPAISKPCEVDTCPIWRHGTWGPCSVSCGLGYQLRGIQCRHINGTPVSDAQCSHDDQPPKRQDCQMPACPAPTLPSTSSRLTHPAVKSAPTAPRATPAASVPAFLRRPSALTPRQSPRPLRPTSSQGSSLSDTPPSVSVSRLPPYSRPLPRSSPVTTMEVLREEPRRRYSSQWRTGMWTECSATCGYRTRERYVSCRDRYGHASEERECDVSSRPLAIEQCPFRQCPHWRTGQWNRCSVTCGHGTTSRYVACVNSDSSIAADDECDLRDKPKEKDVCSQQECLLDQLVSSGMASERAVALTRGRWRTGQWSKCSSTCGSGLRQRVVICQDETGDMETCSDETRPQNIEACNTGIPCPLWSFGEWGQCSAACGGGIKSRLVLCRLRSGRTLPDTSCNILSRPENTKLCSSNPCRNRNIWRANPWSRCSVTCGTGTQQRTVSCVDEAGDEAPSVECVLTKEARPAERRECQEAECLRPTWSVGNWSGCSVTCGVGMQQRTVTCRVGDEREDEACEIGEGGVPKPTAHRECVQVECPRPQWTVGDWSECSVTCGMGSWQRTASCVDETGEVRNDEDCETGEEGVTKPATQVECQQMDCPRLRWTVGDWSECSVTCGIGSRQRTASCVDETVEVRNDEDCETGEEGVTKPATQVECQKVECPRPQWTVGDWSKCSVTCGMGSRQRIASCVDETGEVRNDEDCKTGEEGVTKPATQVECQQVDCPHLRWTVGDWSECSVTCGIGSQQRTASCVDETGEVRNDDDCETGEEGVTKPATQVECQQVDCPRLRWTVGDWSECSMTCGIGSRERTASCVDDTGEVRNDEDCETGEEGVTKPATQKECQQEQCPRPKWTVTEWSECSVSCDKGVRNREATCQIKGQVVEDSLCFRKKPKTSKKCSREKCKIYRWMKGRWSQCSKPCEGGRKLRKVQCTDTKGNEVDNSLCGSRQKPRDNTKCNTHKCDTPRLTWLAGAWTECSKTCGSGIQTRTIACHAHSPDGWAMPTDDDACHQESRPQGTRLCFIGMCSSDIHWMMGPWSQCSKECGGGIKERKVQCRDLQGRRQPRSSCGPPTIRPETREVCNYEPCHPQSCHDVQIQYNLLEDKEYSMLVQGRALSIYCQGMATDDPKEFLSLSAGDVENFAEIYPKRLLRATQCPYNGNRNDACECTDEGHREAGLTTFTKLRLNITNMEIIITDPTFADTRYGKFVPYATAGDCYSSADCPQGRFHINLVGTGLALAPEVNWGTEGYAVTRRLAKDELSQRVAGRCGGFCGTCFPDKRRGGLRLTFIS